MNTEYDLIKRLLAAQHYDEKTSSAIQTHTMQARLVKTQRGHQARINALLILSNANLAVSAGDDGVLKAWDLTTYTSTIALSGHTRSVRALAAYPDGYFIASGSDDATVRIWNMQSGEVARILYGHPAAVNTLAIAVDGTCIASGDAAGMLALWDSTSGHRLRALPVHAAAIHALTFSPDGHSLLVSSVQATGRASADDARSAITMWDYRSGRLLHDFPDVTRSPHTLAFIDNRHFVAADEAGVLSLWDSVDGVPLRQIHTQLTDLVMALMPNRRYVIAGSPQAELSLWHLEAGQRTATLPQSPHGITTIAVTPGGRRVLTGCQNGYLNHYEFTA